jgi:hypothetical protein
MASAYPASSAQRAKELAAFVLDDTCVRWQASSLPSTGDLPSKASSSCFSNCLLAMSASGVPTLKYASALRGLFPANKTITSFLSHSARLWDEHRRRDRGR